MAARGTLPGVGGTDAAVLRVWAKSWPMNQPVEQWLPLWQHLDDAADVAGLLWDEWVSGATRRLFGDALPGGEADGRLLLCWLAGQTRLEVRWALPPVLGHGGGLRR